MATATTALSRGAISRIYLSRDTSDKPVVQVVNLKRLNMAAHNPSGSADAVPRFRLDFSDGQHLMQGMIAKQLNHLVLENKIVPNIVVKLDTFIVQEVGTRRVLIVLNLDILRAENEPLGSPVSVEDLDTRDGSQPSSSQTGGAPGSSSKSKVEDVVGVTRPTSSGIMSMAGPRRTVRPGETVYRDIAAINPYQTGWTIKGRCTFKSDLRTFQNARGEGQVISFELTDKSGSIRITAFSDRASDVVEKVKNGGIYAVSKGQLKQANEKYNRSTSNYEMTLSTTSILRVESDDGSVAPIHYNFTKIADLEKVEVKGACDVVAVVHEFSDATEIIIRSTGEPCLKRSVTLVDDSHSTVELTLWRDQAEKLVTDADRNSHPILVLRNAARGDFGGVCLNTSRSTVIERDLESVPEVARLRAWYDEGGATAGIGLQSLSAGAGAVAGKVLGERRSLEDVQERDIASGGLDSGGSVQFAMRGMVTFLKKDRELSYPSDPTTKKKVTETGEPGVWHSESSGRDFTDAEIVHRYVCQLKVSDFSGAQWMGAFDEGGLVVFGRPAGEMRLLKASDEDLYEGLLDDALFQPLVLKVSVREDSYNGETRVRYTIVRAERVDFVRESQVLLGEIAAYGIG